MLSGDDTEVMFTSIVFASSLKTMTPDHEGFPCKFSSRPCTTVPTTYDVPSSGVVVANTVELPAIRSSSHVAGLLLVLVYT